ncbi:MAG: arylsulfatase [Daejeonella sp.]
MNKKIIFLLIYTCLVAAFTNSIAQVTKKRPNIIFIMADDHGYGDLACYGNPWIKTPNLDKLHSESLRLSNYHTGTTCAPTRASLMTGQHFNRVGVWHTVMGRSLLRTNAVTLPEILTRNGYHTGIFGKWHLGDNYPQRPQDRGFQEVLIHKGGGVGQTPDYWNNNYFDDTYFHNGKPQKYKGYCTDVWFSEAEKFIEQHKNEPFFCYLPLNAAHEPTHVSTAYSSLYKNNTDILNADFYGMITNIDDNVGRLMKKLKDMGLDENTIVIYTTDNGTTPGSGVLLDKNAFPEKGFSYGWRGAKSSQYEGGHRNPFFFKFSGAKWATAQDIPQLASCMDVLPTLLDVCGITLDKNLKLDGQSLLPLMRDPKTLWPNRTIIIDTQRDDFLEKWKKSSLMTNQWRLINGDELYDILKDPSQRKDISSSYPDTVLKLREQYEIWWTDVSKQQNEYVRIAIGGKENPVTLTAHDVHPFTKTMPAWNQVMIRSGDIPTRGLWMIDVLKTGNYELRLQRWPVESGLANTASLSKGEPNPGGKPYPAGKAFNFKKAFVKIGSQKKEISLNAKQPNAIFKLMLPAGAASLEAWFIDEKGEEINAFYVYAKPVK